jgi:hypothetical protein
MEDRMTFQFTYKEVLRASERITWRVEDLIGGDRRLDFTRPFLPESLAGTATLDFLTPEERLTLNHIRGNGYLYMFGMVEEFILPFVLDHARPMLAFDDYRTRALLEFAAEEAKHIQLFKRFREAFEAGFGVPCEMIGPPEAVAKAVLQHQPLAVALTILQIEWMTQRHYLESVRDDVELDPQFTSLLQHHWLEEAGHAKLDTLTVASLAEGLDARSIGCAIDEYFAIGSLLDLGLTQQVAYDIATFTRATGRRLEATERLAFVEAQQKAIRWTFLGSGMTHRNFLATVESLSPAARQRIEAVAPTFC